jgi:hypothetical protein
MPKIGIDIGYYNPRKIVPISFTDGTNSGGGNTSIMTDYLTRLAAEGGSLTAPEIVALNLLTQNADIGEFDRLWIHGLSNQIAARISLVNALTADLITNVNGVTFTPSQGFTGNGVNNYLDSNFAATINGVKYTLNSASCGVYTRLIKTASLVEFGAATSYAGSDGVLLQSNFGGDIYGGINGTYNTLSTINSQGLTALSRSDPNRFDIIKNGSVNSYVASSQPLVSKNFTILAWNATALNFFSDNQVSITFIGSGVIDQSQFYTDIQTLGTTLGWAV